MATIFKNQKLTITLTAKDNDGAIIDLTGRTVHFLTRDPDGNVAIDTTPTIADPTNGEVVHVHAAAVPPADGDLDESGDWMDKLFIDGDEVPSTRYVFHVYERWEK